MVKINEITRLESKLIGKFNSNGLDVVINTFRGSFSYGHFLDIDILSCDFRVVVKVVRNKKLNDCVEYTYKKVMSYLQKEVGSNG